MKQFLMLLLLLIATTTFSQNIVHGTVSDASTKEVVPYANVYFPEIEKGSSTNNEGYFNIENLPLGQYKIIISVIGYETYTETIKIPSQSKLAITLQPSAIEIEEIIVSTPFHKLQSDNVMRVERKNVSELKSEGGINLSQGISSIAGVESISTGNSIGKPVIRGLSSNRVLVYAQGVRLENQQFGDEHGLGVNDAGIESIEVIKGPASLLYGSDALGGVLYLNPERFANSNTSAADINASYFSNSQGYSTNLGYKSSGEAIKFIFRGSLAEHSDYDTKNYRVTNSRFKEQDFKGALGYQKNNFKTELRYNLNASKLGIPEEIGDQSTSKIPLLPFQQINNHIFSSKSKLFFNDASLDINLGYIYNDRKEFEEHHHDEDEEEEEEHEEFEESPEEAALHMKLKTFNYDLKYHLPELGKFETVIGSQGLHQINTNYGEEELIPDASTTDFGFMAMSHIHLNHIDVQLGARYDRRQITVNNQFKRDFNSFNGALGAKTTLFKEVALRVNLASGFRAPNLAELASNGTHEGTNRYEIGNPDLNNEQSFQSDISLEYKKEHFEIFVNGFYNTIQDYIFLTPNGEFIGDDPVFLYKQDRAKLYGGEIGLHLHPHPLDWLHLETTFETVTGEQDNGDYLPLIPANKLTNTIRLKFENTTLKHGSVFIKLSSTFNQKKISAFETPTNSYSLLSAGFSGDITVFKKKLSFAFSGTNLLNKVYINHLSRLKTDGIANMGRNIALSISYNL